MMWRRGKFRSACSPPCMKTETSNSVWSVTFSNKFLYDGWNLLAELNGTNGNLISSYTWGPDMSGGVGRLVSIRPSGAPANFVAYDGSGNVVALIDGSLGTVV